MEQGRPGETYIIAGPRHTFEYAFDLAASIAKVRAPLLHPGPHTMRAMAAVMSGVGRFVHAAAGVHARSVARAGRHDVFRIEREGRPRTWVFAAAARRRHGADARARTASARSGVNEGWDDLAVRRVHLDRECVTVASRLTTVTALMAENSGGDRDSVISRSVRPSREEAAQISEGACTMRNDRLLRIRKLRGRLLKRRIPEDRVVAKAVRAWRRARAISPSIVVSVSNRISLPRATASAVTNLRRRDRGRSSAAEDLRESIRIRRRRAHEARRQHAGLAVHARR